MSTDYLSRLAHLERELSNFANDYSQKRRDGYDRDRHQGWKNTLLAILRGVVGVVQDSHNAESDDLHEVLEKAESTLNSAITIAYDGWDSKLFESIESFAHDEERPLVQLDLGENVHRECSADRCAYQ